MRREEAVKQCHELLIARGLKDWHVRISLDASKPFLGLCDFKNKCIILNAHHIDQHPDEEVDDTIKHEVAHAEVGTIHGHNEIWQAKARELGCDPIPCSHLSLSPEILNAIRSGADVQFTVEEEQVILRRPKYTVTRLQDKCETCGKVIVVKSEKLIERDDDRPNLKIYHYECGHTRFVNIPKGTPFHKFYFLPNEESHSCQHEWDKNKCTKCTAFRPYDFQVEGMRFIETAVAVNKGAAVFDEMGLGKTIQVLGYINYHPEAWPVLYVVKSKIKYQWYRAILNWLGEKFVGQVLTSGKDFIIPGLRTYICSYDLLVPKVRKSSKTGKVTIGGFDIEKLKKAGIKTIVLDECQQIKNVDSNRTKQIRQIVTDKFWGYPVKVIGLSGTPWKNRGSEFYPILNMLSPIKFGNFENFKKRWVGTYWHGKYLKEAGIKNIPEFKEYIRDIAIRRERKEVMKELPLVNRTKLYVEMSEAQEEEYDIEVQKFVEWYNNAVIGGEEEQLSGIAILGKMARMRHLTGLAKIEATLDYVREFIEETERKLVIFVHHQDVGEVLYQEAKARFEEKTKTEDDVEDVESIPVFKLPGNMSDEEMFAIQEKFNNTKRCIMIASTLAAGEGLNLQTCSDCIIHERQWNPANEEQAEGRFIRIGQTSDSVNAIYAEAVGAIDERLDGIVERKRGWQHDAMNTGSRPQWSQDSFAKELAEVIVKAFNEKKKRKEGK
jgi:SNF2 family DNA or RNA helicase